MKKVKIILKGGTEFNVELDKYAVLFDEFMLRIAEKEERQTFGTGRFETALPFNLVEGFIIIEEGEK